MSSLLIIKGLENSTILLSIAQARAPSGFYATATAISRPFTSKVIQVTGLVDMTLNPQPIVPSPLTMAIVANSIILRSIARERARYGSYATILNNRYIYDFALCIPNCTYF